MKTSPITNLVKTPCRDINVDGVAMLVESAAKRSSSYALDLVEKGLGEDITPHFLLTSMPEYAHSFDTSGKILAEGRKKLTNILGKNGLQEDATVGDFLQHEERQILNERVLDYLS